MSDQRAYRLTLSVLALAALVGCAGAIAEPALLLDESTAAFPAVLGISAVALHNARPRRPR